MLPVTNYQTTIQVRLADIRIPSQLLQIFGSCKFATPETFALTGVDNKNLQMQIGNQANPDIL